MKREGKGREGKGRGGHIGDMGEEEEKKEKEGHFAGSPRE